MDIFDHIKQGDETAVRRMVEQQPSLVNARNQDGLRPVMLAVYYGQRSMAEFLRQEMESVNGWEAAALGELDTLQEILSKEPELLNAFSPDGFTSLGLAAFFGRTDVLAWLLEQGADPNIAARNAMAVRPIHSGAANRDPETSLTIVRLLVSHGAEVNVSQRGGWTPLHQAADHDQRELVVFLLEAGADPALKSADGRTAKDMAKAKGFDQTAALLR